MNYANDQHTPLDLARFAVEGIDPDTREPRKMPVSCPWCPRTQHPTVWNLSGLCDRHEAAEDRLLRELAATPPPPAPAAGIELIIDLRTPPRDAG